MEELLKGGRAPDGVSFFYKEEDLVRPLEMCYKSLWESGSGIIADGRLLDLLRRVHCFGMSLMKMDLRQESTKVR